MTGKTIAFVGLTALGGYFLINGVKSAATMQQLDRLDIDFETVKFRKVDNGTLIFDLLFQVANPLNRELEIEFMNLELKYHGKRFADVRYVKSTNHLPFLIKPLDFTKISLPVLVPLPVIIFNVGLDLLQSMTNPNPDRKLSIKGDVRLNNQNFNVDKDIDLQGIDEFVKVLKQVIK